MCTCIKSELVECTHKSTLRALEIFIKKNPIALNTRKYVDLGCGNGTFTLEVAKILGTQQIYGVEISDKLVLEGRDKGIKAVRADLNYDRLPFLDEEFDVASSFSVIEFLWNPDNMISEAYRVLRPAAHFILTTPNLASWVNRLLLLFGYLPVYHGLSLKYELEKRPLQEDTSYPTGHIIRQYTFKTLKTHLELYNFRVIYSTAFAQGFIENHLITKPLDKIISIKKTLGTGIFMVAIKK
jgi:ubiquinone/menaquinone biosynthesis C-methylase UbiE